MEQQKECTDLPVSIKIITAWDAVFTLFVEHVGTTFHLPAYHPAIIGTVIGGTYILLKHKDKVSDLTMGTVKRTKQLPEKIIPRKTGLNALN